MKQKLFLLMLLFSELAVAQQVPLNFYAANHSFIQYTGRIDFSNIRLPRFWQPGVYIQTKFYGSNCEVIVNDEELWGKNHNYLEIVVDGKPTRLQTKAKRDTIKITADAANSIHTLLICKNTEANIGYMELVGIRCQKLIQPDKKHVRKIECIGNSITCGTGSDISEIPCGKGVWQDQHNTYLSYGAVAARALNAQYHLSSVSGIGLMHSCCNLKYVMPQVFDKINMRDDTIAWNFENYVPDVLTVCLGQNDGIQDSLQFTNNYIIFLKKLRSYYPNTTIICISSPMADDALRSFMKKSLIGITNALNKSGDKNIYKYVFEKQYSSGCDYHPDIKEHAEIAGLLTAFIKKVKNW